MNNTESITTVKELIAILKKMPENTPVLVSGYENGYENFYQPMLKKVVHFPENMYFDGEYQFEDNDKGMEAVILERVVRND